MNKKYMEKTVPLNKKERRYIEKTFLASSEVSNQHKKQLQTYLETIEEDQDYYSYKNAPYLINTGIILKILKKYL